MRQPKPWFRKQTDTWYVQLGKDQIPLVKGRGNEKAAYEAYFRVMAEQQANAPPEPDKLTVARLADEFLKWSEKHNSPETFDWHKVFLQNFCDAHGRRLAAEVIPYHVTTWLDQNPSWKGGRRHATYCVKRAFTWGHKQGLLTTNPLAAVSVGRSPRREGSVSKEARQAILAAIPDQAFRDFVTALQETGCRPSEVARVTAENADLEIGVWVLPEHKTEKKTHKPRVVYLTPPMVEMTRRLMASWPDGPLFRTHRGKRPWKRNAIRCRFMRLRKKLPELGHVVSYHYRHSYVTDALVNGVGIAQVAELVGHTSTDMVMRHYSKLSQQVTHMRDAARRATGA
jgi:integrase